MVLPSHINNSIESLNIINNILGKDTIVSIMSQYSPFGDLTNFPEINRTITKLEYKVVVSHALKLSMNNCLVQELSSCAKTYTPNFQGSIFEI